MRRATLWLALSVTLVVAGCGSIAGDDGDTTSTAAVTPVDVPESEETAPLVAPGITSDRLVDTRALVANHANTLRNNSYTYREQVTRRDANGTIQRRYVARVQKNGSTVRYRYNRSATGEYTRTLIIDRWSAGDRVYVARTTGNETNITVEERSATGAAIPFTPSDYASSLRQVFRLLDIEMTGSLRDNPSLYRLSTPTPETVQSSRNVTFVGLVTAEGVFTRYRLTYETGGVEDATHVTVQVSFENVGSTTVDRPAWVGRATNSTAAG
jgi:hypothetical protein